MDNICTSQCPRLFIRPITTLPYKQNNILVVMYEQVIKGSPIGWYNTEHARSWMLLPSNYYFASSKQNDSLVVLLEQAIHGDP